MDDDYEDDENFDSGYRTDVIYVYTPPYGEHEDIIYVSPDGIGRIFFDSIREAKEQTGVTSVLHTEVMED